MLYDIDGRIRLELHQLRIVFRTVGWIDLWWIDRWWNDWKSVTASLKIHFNGHNSVAIVYCTQYTHLHEIFPAEKNKRSRNIIAFKFHFCENRHNSAAFDIS